MPTIDELPPAPACADTDLLMLSQSGISRAATRAQLLAGFQPALLPQTGTLLGRSSAGPGAPEAIGIGANLTLAQGVLSGEPAFAVAGQPAGSPVAASDLVAVGQSGGNAAVSYDSFMRGLAGLADVQGGSLQIGGAVSGVDRTLAQALQTAAPIEAFGARGDGITDDSAALVAAAAGGQPVRLDGRVYVIDGPVALANAVLIGIAGATILRRSTQSASGAWISFSGTILAAGVVFDAAGIAAMDGPAVSLGRDCTNAVFEACAFINATGATAGNGIAVGATSTTTCALRRCSATGNALHGILATSCAQLTIDACTLQQNGGFGASITGSTMTTLSCATVQGNATGGVSVRGAAVLIETNRIAAADGSPALVFRGSGAVIAGNVLSGGSWGIDARGSATTRISGNQVSGAGIGIDAGGTQNVLVSGNMVEAAGSGIAARNIEASASMLPVTGLSIESNWVGFSSSQATGISILDGAQGVLVRSNAVSGWGSAAPVQALQLNTDAAIVSGNTWNNTAQWQVSAAQSNGLQSVVVPDIADSAVLLSAPDGVQAVLGQYQLAMAGRIGFITVTAAGSGYSAATVSILGSGAGATAVAILSAGAVVGVQITNAGAGYAGTPATVTISGDGSGAAASATVGLPVLAGRRLRLACTAAVTFARAGSSPFQENWTLFDTTVPANASVTLEGMFGEWRLLDVPPGDYLAPTGDGGVVLRPTASGDLTLRGGASGQIHVATAAEPVGYSACVGSGSPLGQVSAPPGSDYRNVEGGPGQTLWIKQSGNDSSGWVAVA